MADEALVDVLAKREPKLIPGEPQAYKRAVIRMVLQHIEDRSAALDELARIGQEMDEEDRRREAYREEQEFFFQG